MTKKNLIELSGVYKSFGKKEVLKGIDLSIEEGQSVVVIGGSGSGKSVMMKTILGLLKPDSGSIKVNGIETTNLNEAQHHEVNKLFGMLFQNGALFDSLTIWENVAFAAIQNSKCSEEEARHIALEALERVGLGPDLLDMTPASLSGGMHKRVGLARAIANRPKILFFDEPTTGLDPIMTDVINHLIRECVQDLGASTLTITHDMSSVRAIADKVAFLYLGKIIWQGALEDMQNSDNAYLTQFVNGDVDGPIFVEGAQ
ncbi:MAG: ABC transporter ATP-binding protein [Parvibaculales bacterium]